MEVWPGFCCIHNDVTLLQVASMRELHPNAEMIVHPEAKLEIVEKADFIGSTKGLLNHVIESDVQEFIVGTEEGIMYTMQQACPDKKFYLLSPDLKCYDMKLTRLEDIYYCLRDDQYEIDVPESVRIDAFKALDKMLKLS